MADNGSFTQFSRLPAELRIKIWKHALSSRTLQVGIDFPFPFLPPEDLKEDCLWPVPCTVPTLFSICHESRQLCLSEYIPFAYSFLHPSLDTLYMSRKAAARLYVNAFRSRGIVRAPLYPIALLDRLVIEFNALDLPKNLRPSASSAVFNTYCHIMEMFGPPKRLLLVDAGPQRLLNQRPEIPGWRSLEFVESLEEQPRGRDKPEILGFVRKTLEMDARYNPWLGWRIPEVAVIDAELTGRIYRDSKDTAIEQLVNALNTTAIQWQNEWTIQHRTWDWDKDGNPYGLENMELALSRFKQQAV